MIAWANQKWGRLVPAALACLTWALTSCGPLPLSMAPCTPQTFFSLGQRETNPAPYIQRCPARYLELWQSAYLEGQELAPLHQSILDASASQGTVSDRLYGRAKLSSDERDRLNNEETRLQQESKRLQSEFERRAGIAFARLRETAAELKWTGQTHAQAMQPTRQERAKR
jgi:hypothetical protein